MNESYLWYAELLKPEWAPPSWLFGPVWSVLYVGIFITFCIVFYTAAQKKIPRSVALPFVLNLIANVLFTPIQFGLQNNILAAFDIILVLGTLVWGMSAVYPYKKWITYAQAPYLLWVGFATVLQFTITYLNWN